MNKPLPAALAAFVAGAALASPVFAADPVPPPPRAGTPAAGPASAAAARPSAEEIARQITAGRRFPITVDEMSRLDSVQGRGDTLTYNYTVIGAPPTREERLQLGQQVRDDMQTRACAAPDFVKLMEGGYTVRLNYAFGNPEEDIHVTVTPQSCRR